MPLVAALEPAAQPAVLPPVIELSGSRFNASPLQRLSIRAKLMLAVGAALVAVLLLTGAAVVVLLDSIDKAARLEAHNLAATVAAEAPTKGAELQAYVRNLASIQHRDIFLVDRERRPVAGVLTAATGERYRGDEEGEIEFTVRDGKTRAFTEVSARHPNGAALLVIPWRQKPDASSAVIGAVVVEYTEVERQLFSTVAWGLYLIGFIGLLAVLAVGFFGYRLAEGLARGIGDVRRGVLAFASGDTAIRIPLRSADEVGDLTQAFNRMADDLDSSRRDLLQETVLAREAARQAERLAYTDMLTGLPNRTQLARLMSDVLGAAESQGHQVGVLFLDLDRFKNINDTLGHEAGDTVLKKAAAHLRQCLGPHEHVARLGGDEFVVLVSHVAAPGSLASVARRILAAIAQPFHAGSQELRMTCSIGISVFPRDGRDQQTLKKNADIALYRAKDDGRNGFAFYVPELNPHSVEKLAFESELRRAIDQRQLKLHYQPKVDPVTRRVLGVEALVRWDHPTMGCVPPARLIPVAEETGLIVPLGRWVLAEACRQQVAWREAGQGDVTMAVNLSVRQFVDSSLVADVREVIDRSGIAPQKLELEITESLLMRNEASGMKMLHQLKALGVRLAVDDFGTGYSSLANLKRFPIDTLKIDRAFVRDLDRNDEDQAIVQAIISMAKSLGLHIVAEGVETDAQRSFLSDRGCDELQGYLFCKPVPPDQIRLSSPCAQGSHAQRVGEQQASLLPVPANRAV